MSDLASTTPMFRQYRTMKETHQDAILLFRMGDFYEMFYEDARIASALLDLALTARGKGTAHVVPMCGFPHHQLGSYTARLVKAGRSVAICDQVEDPRTAKGLVRREVVRVVTPGTLTDPEHLDARENAWIASVAAADGGIGAAFVDLSTGEFLAWQSPAEGDPLESLAERLVSFAPREIVVPDECSIAQDLSRDRIGQAIVTATEAYSFGFDAAAELLARHFQVASLDGFGLRDRPLATAASGGLLHYLQETQKATLSHLDGIALHEPATTVLLDATTRRNLEIERNLRDGSRRGTLVDAVDRTMTAGGARQLRRWLLAPLLDPAAIAARLDAVEELLIDASARRSIHETLRGFHDLERLLGRTVTGAASPRDLVALARSLEVLPPLFQAVASFRSTLVRETVDSTDPCADVAARLSAALLDQPPVVFKEGGLIRDGFHPEVDELRALRRDARSYLASLETREREATGIGSLKVRFNKVFGYYIEVSKPNLHLVPATYQRKQTIAGGERFVTPELKDLEARILTAEERLTGLEAEIFLSLRAETAAAAHRIKEAARSVSTVDVLAALAETAAVRAFRRPVVDHGTRLRIVAGRHPVVEENLPPGRFVPNDTDLDAQGESIAILTGPNMGGKSTYLRQVALIALLAQSGSFVPADEAEIGLVDRIFCRVGASDSLAEGQSTFMVEMTETAKILRHAGPRSLALLDEIGRGTSTFDGLAIAWAVVEHLRDRGGGPLRTLFATHYHELTELAVALPGVVNWRMAVRERGESVVFLHRVERGAADRSYGIHVARLAGLPPAVVHRAKEVLANLERDEYGRDGLPRRARRAAAPAASVRQPTLFAPAPAEGLAEPADPAAAEILAELREKDPDRLTPLDALQLLAGWRRRLRDGP